MKENEKNLNNVENTQAAGEQEHLALDDARRVKVMSPGMMVFKRFVRNKLAIVGFCIIVFMFIFSFIGPFFSPYKIADQFRTDEVNWGDYSTGKFNTDPRYITAEGAEFNPTARTAMLLAISETYKKSKKEMQEGDELQFEANGENYHLTVADPDPERPVYFISQARTIAKTGLMGQIVEIDPEYDTPAFREFLTKSTEMAKRLDGKTLEFEGKTFMVSGKFNDYSIQVSGDPNVLVTYDVFLSLKPEFDRFVKDFDFAMTVNEASYNGENSFEYDGRTFGLEVSDDGKVVSENGEEIFMLSDIVFGAAQVGTVLSGDFYAEAQKAIRTNSDTFEFVNDKGENTSARINLVNGNYYIQTMQTKTRLDIDAPPTKQNPLGTDHYAFDVLTRLMYGGRVSLLVGFVVVFFEMFIGVIIGGISGYFGGWVDTILMRVVDLVNAVPFYPVVIILGTVFDHLEVDQVSRLFFLMVVLGIMGWTGIARVVRGQILSLREQDFMVATEATGVRISRRIFRHLIPNVMPLLIVNATMGLGGIIITEATLGFLGLGVKYPMASWGSIINEATDMYVMTNCWWIWIPAGLFILLTVLGFNFIGDGLRDAFDPKMKR